MNELVRRMKNRDALSVGDRFWMGQFGHEFPSVLSTRSWDKMFDNFFNDSAFSNIFDIQREFLTDKSSVPYDVINLTDKDGKETGLEMQFAIAGYKKDDVSVEFNTETGVLTVSAKKSSEEGSDDTDKQTKYLYKGIKRSEWSVSYMLSDNIDKDGLKSELKDGTLKVTIPYIEKDDNPKALNPVKKIDIQS